MNVWDSPGAANFRIRTTKRIYAQPSPFLRGGIIKTQIMTWGIEVSSFEKPSWHSSFDSNLGFPPAANQTKASPYPLDALNRHPNKSDLHPGMHLHRTSMARYQ